jgi:hypothetical protein
MQSWNDLPGGLGGADDIIIQHSSHFAATPSPHYVRASAQRFPSSFGLKKKFFFFTNQE